MLSLIPLIKIYPKKQLKGHWAYGLVGALLFAGLCIYAYKFGVELLKNWAIKIEIADMLPVISKMNQRWLESKEVYAIIPEIWGGMQPIYLPAMWMGYLPAFIFEFDLRWMSIGFILFGILLCTILLPDFKKRNLLSLLPIGAGFLFFYTLANKDPQLIAFSEEGMVIGYYLLVIFMLFRGNNFFKGLAFSLCLMSRYSLLFWLAMYVVYIYFYQSKKDAIWISLYTALSCLFLMIVSQGIYQLDTFIGLPKIYDQAISDPGLKWKYEPMINRNLGIAKYFSYENLSHLSTLFKITSISLPFICLFLYSKFKERINKPLFVFCTLKLCLVIFYSFLIMPFKYLFFTSTVLTIGLFAVMLAVDSRLANKA
ncbi:MAG: hypothetical protein AAGK97_07120 [Bacteroidota bacterium]